MKFPRWESMVGLVILTIIGALIGNRVLGFLPGLEARCFFWGCAMGATISAGYWLGFREGWRQ